MSKPHKRSLHLLNIIGICICTMILVTCLGVIFAMDDAGLMYASGSTLKTILMDQAAYDNAVWALSARDKDFNAQFMEDNGCNIAVIEGDFGSIRSLDLNDDYTFIFKNFDGELPSEYYTVSVYVSDYTDFSLSENMFDFLFRENNLINDYYGYESEIKDIKGIGYDMLGQKAYVWDGENFYLLSEDSYSYTMSDEGGTYNTTNIYDRIWASQVPEEVEDHSYVAAEETDESTAEKQQDTAEETDDSTAENQQDTAEESEIDETDNTTDEEATDNEENLPAETINTTQTPAAGSVTSGNILFIDGKPYSSLGSDDSEYVLELNGYTSSGVLALSNVADLTDLHDQLKNSDIETCTLDSVSTVYAEKFDSNYDLYTVISFPRDIQTSGSFFVQASYYLEIIPVLHILLPVACVVAALVLLVLVIVLIVRAGQYENKGSLNTDILASFPMEVTFALACVAECIPGILMGYAYETRLPENAGAYFIIVLGATIAVVIGTLWFESVVINFKSGHFYRNTLCYKIIMWIGKILGRIKDKVVAALRTVKWGYRIIGISAVIVILEFLGMVTIDDMDSIIFLWFIEKIILALVLVKVLLDYGKVKKAAVEMAAGNMDVSVNTEGMFIDFEEHGEALNEIASGLNNAISERMKSERMKTELITNVSHDIKTPLTSVINYVDLLQKEDFENETARGYLEVLDRQAKRLKKLIEDLIEASKAATGSIKFNIENVNARVLLNQSIGEFDDRLTDKNITVVTEVPEKDVYVKADNRYLFRVFDNLMSNIVKYSQEGTRAYVELKEKDGRAQYTFKNISREKLNISADELMERFVRGDLSRNTEGNGLGLSIARSLTESMGGKMELTIDGDLFKVDVSFPEQPCA